MTAPKHRRLQRLLQHSYPIHVVCEGSTFAASYPDLPGVRLADPDLGSLYGRLELMRRAYVTQAVADGQPVALPNSHTPTPA